MSPLRVDRVDLRLLYTRPLKTRGQTLSIHGERLTLYFRVGVGGETAFYYHERAVSAHRVLLPRKGGIGAFYWSDKGFGYAIAAKADRALLPRIAELVYRADLSGRRQRQDPADAGEAQLILAE